MSETWQKRLLIAAAAWNLLGGAASLMDPAAHPARSSPPFGAARVLNP